MTTFILPGLGGSSAAHWQRWWLTQDPDARLVEQADWEAPELTAWLARLESALDGQRDAIIVAHSLACSLVAHLAVRRPDLDIAGALMVAPADVDEGSSLPDRVRGFAPMPLRTLPFPAIVVGSSNDPFVRINRAMAFAAAWGARFVHLRDSGHINVDSGFGPWPDGIRLAKQLRDPHRLAPPRLHLAQAAAPGFV